MSTGFISQEIRASLSSPCDYIIGTYQAAYYNFASSTDFNSIEERTNEIAEYVFDQDPTEPACDLKLSHFFSHVAVGIILIIPIVNVILFACLACEKPEEEEEEFTQDMPEIIIDTLPEPTPEPIIVPKVKPTGLPSRLSTLVESDLSPKIKPEHEIHIEIPTSPLRNHRKSTSRVMQRAIAIQENYTKSEFQKIIGPDCNGKRTNEVSIGEFHQIENRFTRRFFRLFPNETKVAEFAKLRKKYGSTDGLDPLYEDKKFIEPLFLNSPGYTPEVRFMDAEQNLNALYTYLENMFSHLNREFYLEGNYKNDMQRSKSEIPYIHIVEIMFTAPLEEFTAELEKINFVELSPLEGERIPIRVDPSF